jgi:hypothetical protein
MMTRLPVCILLASLPGVAMAGDDASDVRQRIIARQKALNNLTVLYQRADRFDPPPDIPQVRHINGGAIVLLTDPEEFRAEFRYLRGQAMHSRERLGAVQPRDIKRLVHAIANDRQETLNETIAVEGVIGRTRRLPTLEYIDVALGLRAHLATDWLSSETLEYAKLTRHEDGRISLSWVDGAAAEETYFFDPKFDYAMVEYVRRRGRMVVATIRNSDFRRVGKVFLPYKSVYEEYRREAERDVPSSWVLMNVVEYKLDDDRNANDDFRIEWPLGATIVDLQSGLTIHVTSRPQKLDDKLLRSLKK